MNITCINQKNYATLVEQFKRLKQITRVSAAPEDGFIIKFYGFYPDGSEFRLEKAELGVFASFLCDNNLAEQFKDYVWKIIEEQRILASEECEKNSLLLKEVKDES